MNVKWIVAHGVIGLSMALLAGCGDTKPGNDAVENPSASAGSAQKSAHGGWWCDEHGMPEEVCAQCDSKLAAEFQKKGDWCKEHDRPDSQCFVCHPELKDRFAAQYRAKYGKEPPPMEEHGEHGRHEHGSGAK
jgi:hypothetical protein